MLEHDVDVLIIGGGVIGLSAGIGMRLRGYSVAILDAGHFDVDLTKPDSRVYAVNQASIDLFNALDVWSQLDKTRISPYQNMHVWDAASGAHIDFDSRMVAASQLGFIIQQSVIKQALLQRLSQLGVTLFPASRVAKLHAHPNGLIIQDNQLNKWQAKLTIVADGALSKMRDLLNVSVTSWPYHQAAIVVTVQHTKPHQHIAYQVFTSQGPLAFLPLSDPYQSSIVWSTGEKQAERLMSLSDKAFSEQLTKAFQSTLGQNQTISSRHRFPLYMRHVDKYAGKHWILMGDAAHTIHPLAGLGLNVGLSDLAVWLNYLDRYQLNLHSKPLFKAYQRQRKSALWQTIGLMEGLKMLFLNPFPPLVSLRGLGLALCNRFVPVKQLFIKHAMGQQ